MKQLQLDAFTKYQFLSNLNYSPAGDKAALVAGKANVENNNYDFYIWLYENGSFKQLTGSGKERNYVWEDNTHLLFTANRSEKEKKDASEGKQVTNYYRISTQGGEASKAFSLPVSCSLIKKVKDNLWLAAGEALLDYPDFYKLSETGKNEVVEKIKADENYEVFTEAPFYGNGAGFTAGKRSVLYLVNTDTLEIEMLNTLPFNAYNPVVSGNEIYFAINNAVGKKPFRTSLAKYDMANKEVTRLTGEDDFALEDLSLIGDKLLVIGNYVDDDPYQIEDELNYFVLEGNELKLLADCDDNYGNSVGSDSRLGHGKSVKPAKDGAYIVKTIRSAAVLQKLTLDGKFIDVINDEGSVDDFDVNDNGEVLVIGLYGTKLQEVYDGNLKQLSDFNSEVLKDVYLADYHKMIVQSHGWDIDGWVLLPKDYDETKTYPAILDIHGGPRTAYGEVFYHEMQLWANQGYFVLFCNPVGGAGRGKEFADISGKYGTIDFENIMDFTDAVLKAYPQIDPKRVGETGGSYGGFMSNWIMGHTDRFAAIATQRSISNWISFYGVSDIGFPFVKGQNKGDIYSEERLANAWRQSPIAYVNNMKTPTLVIHSDQDYRCPLEQGLQLFTALQEKGVESRLCLFHNENHELSRSGKPQGRIRRLREITDWMDKHCK